MCRDEINRRRFIRVKFPFTIHLYPLGSPPISAYTEDVSAGGAKVTIHEELELSTLIDLEVYIKIKPLTCKGRVVWINKRESEYFEEESFYDIGIEFQGLSPEEKVVIKETLDRIADGPGAIEKI